MFYLINFLKTVAKNPIRGAGFIVLTFSLLFSLGIQDLIEKGIEKKLNFQSNEGDYFHALIPTKYNDKKIARKLGGLPGVKKVELLGQEVVSTEVEKLLEDFPRDTLGDLKVDYFGVKVIFITQITKRSQGLIRSYLKRLVGDDELTIGQVYEKEKNVFSSEILKRYGSQTSYALLGLFWLISFLLFNTRLLATSYIIENFQRRRFVALKSMVSAVSVIIFFAVATLLFVAKSNALLPISIGILLILLSIIYSRKVAWE